MKPLTRAAVREIDRRAIEEFGLPGLVLMENAGRGCVDVLLRLGCRGPVAIVCGKGNNAGDGFVIARHLDADGIAVRLILLAAPAELRGDAAANYAVLARCGFEICDLSAGFQEPELQRQLAGAEWIVDALLGTGASGSPREPFAAAIRAMNAAGGRKLAVDLPSGLDCDTGIPAEPTFRADQTCTFVAPKVGFSAPSAQVVLGEIHVVPIGVPHKLLADFREA
jgi:NAD(P)H-hydrate epimerase